MTRILTKSQKKYLPLSPVNTHNKQTNQQKSINDGYKTNQSINHPMTHKKRRPLHFLFSRYIDLQKAFLEQVVFLFLFFLCANLVVLLLIVWDLVLVLMYVRSGEGGLL